MNYSVKPIGFIRSPFKQKFGTPRQPRLIKNTNAELHLLPEFGTELSIKGLEQFSHLWLLFIFDQTVNQGWKPTVRPPRLGGNQQMGVFATRSNFRPNAIGISAVELDKIEHNDGKIILHLSGVDLVDNTPIIDIKPYIPYSDCINDAQAGQLSSCPIKALHVIFTETASAVLDGDDDLKQFITNVIEYDPRPAYKSKQLTDQIYGLSLENKNIQFTVQNNIATVFNIEEND